jgi:hypothetical protein
MAAIADSAFANDARSWFTSPTLSQDEAAAAEEEAAEGVGGGSSGGGAVVAI